MPSGKNRRLDIDSKNSDSGKILLVDNNPDNLKGLRQELEELGFDLLVTGSGEEALKIAHDAEPVLILLETELPDRDGFEVCSRLQAEEGTREIAIIFLSACDRVEDKVRALDLGAVDYIGKPYQLREVMARIRRHLKIQDHENQLEQEVEELEFRLGEGFRDLTDEDLAAMIRKGETERQEFKSTLRWNLHTNKPDKRIENSCLKTLAAYLNSSGGILLVGVGDEGEALGLEADGFANEDNLLLHLNTLIMNHLGGEFSQLIHESIHNLDGQRVLAVQCLPSSQPVFFRRDNDEQFYVRVGPSSQALAPSEVLAYVKNR